MIVISDHARLELSAQIRDHLALLLRCILSGHFFLFVLWLADAYLLGQLC
jgi:hypothetical protein